MIKNQEEMLKQLNDFQKAAFENSFNTMAIVQNRTEKVMEMVLNHTIWMSEKWQKAITDWNIAYQDGWNVLKERVEDNLEKVKYDSNKN